FNSASAHAPRRAGAYRPPRQAVAEFQFGLGACAEESQGTDGCDGEGSSVSIRPQRMRRGELERDPHLKRFIEVSIRPQRMRRGEDRYGEIMLSYKDWFQFGLSACAEESSVGRCRWGSDQLVSIRPQRMRRGERGAQRRTWTDRSGFNSA